MNLSASASKELPTVPLGRTGMHITRVGFGSWALGGGDWAAGWGDQSDTDSIAAIRHAVAAGVNWIDTAAIYGLGRSESVIAQALRGMSASERPYVFTKCGLLGDPADPRRPPRFVGAPDSIRREVEGSLRRLEVDCIDLYQMHWPPKDGTPVGVYWQILLDLKKEGKIRAAGLSNHDLAQLAAAEAVGHVDTLQPPFSAIRREAAEREIGWCAAHGTGVIVYSPMQSGLLTGAINAHRVAALPADDWRSGDREFKENLARNLQLTDALARIAKRRGASIAALAVAWTLAWPGVTGAIVGARKPDQVDGWLGAATLDLDTEEMGEIAGAIRASRAGGGPDQPARGAAGAERP